MKNASIVMFASRNARMVRFLKAMIFISLILTCTECVGHHDLPQCMEVCPVDCIDKDAKHVEDKESLYQKYLKLIA